MPVARIVAAIGRTLITVGLLLLLFVAYQLWGTGIAEARAQDDLRDDFEAALAAAPTAPVDTAPPTSTATTAEGAGPPTSEVSEGTGTTAPAPDAAEPVPGPPPVPRGEALAVIRIPRIGLDKAVVEGVSVGDLKKGPGHYPGTPEPGQPGNAAIAGHRTTYGAPFGSLGELEDGDEILVTTRQGEFRYLVDRISVVSPAQVEVLQQTDEARITLTTCHPRYSARQRLIVSGVLTSAPAPAPPTTIPADPGPGDLVVAEPEPGGEPDGQGTPPTADDDPVIAGSEGTEPALALDDPSLAGDPTARGPAAAWGGATALIAFAAWLLGQRWRRWPSYLLGLPFGAVTLFLCFEQIARLLPANI